MTGTNCLKLALLYWAVLFGLAACMPAVETPDIGRPTAQTAPQAPPGAAKGTCWYRNTSPAIIETVTEQLLVQPAEIAADGQIIRPAIFRTVTRQDIVQPRKDSWIEIPCEAQMTPEFIASVQRALSARGYYDGAITGLMDRSTRIALRRFQTEAGLNSSTLSLDTARRLGLVAIAQ